MFRPSPCPENRVRYTIVPPISLDSTLANVPGSKVQEASTTDPWRTLIATGMSGADPPRLAAIQSAISVSPAPPVAEGASPLQVEKAGQPLLTHIFEVRSC